MIYCEECGNTAGDWMDTGLRLICNDCAARLYADALAGVAESAGQVIA